MFGLMPNAYALCMGDRGISEIGRELAKLFDLQMRTIAGRGVEGLNEEELKTYQARKKRIAALRDQLALFEQRN